LRPTCDPDKTFYIHRAERDLAMQLATGPILGMIMSNVAKADKSK